MKLRNSYRKKLMAIIRQPKNEKGERSHLSLKKAN